MIQKAILELDSFQFTERIMDTIPDVLKDQHEGKEYLESFYLTYFDNYFRTLKLENSIVLSIENTKNNTIYRRVPFPTLFINNYFKIKNKIISGIFLKDYSYGALVRDSGEVIYEKSIDIFFFNIEGDRIQTYYYTYGNEFDHLSKKVSNIVSNTIDLLNSKEDINIEEILISKERNGKRRKRNKKPLPNKIIIKPKKSFYKYLQKLEKDSRNISHKFMVRGHWRHLKSDKFNKKGDSIWIKPYFKGEGIYIAKKYELKK